MEVGELPICQSKALLPDPLCDAALVLLEHPVQIAHGHGHVFCNGFRVEFALCQVFGDEPLSPQEAEMRDVIAPRNVMPVPD